MLVKATGKAKSEPPWGRVMANTIRLWVRRRLAAWRWRLVSLFVALVLGTVASLLLTGVFAGTTSLAARVSTPSPTAPTASTGPGTSTGPVTSTGTAVSSATSVAATWIASQVGANTIIACYPVMCAALQARGVIAGRLMPLGSGAASPAGADVVVTSSPATTKLAEHYAPALVASFGSGQDQAEGQDQAGGQDQIDVWAAEPGGPAAYAAALRADLAARRSAGSQLASNSRITFSSRDDVELRAGEVDSRLLATLAELATEYPVRVVSFGDTSPGAAVLFRGIIITTSGRDAAADLAATLAMVRAQRVPYLPARAAIVHPTAGPAALSIEFAAPSPLGLLTAVLTANER
jgi:hypothetical protein